MQIGKDDDAVKAFKKARHIEPHDIPRLFSEGKAWDRLGQHWDALHLFDIALGEEPGNGEILLRKGKPSLLLTVMTRPRKSSASPSPSLPTTMNLRISGQTIRSCSNGTRKPIWHLTLRCRLTPITRNIWTKKGQALAHTCHYEAAISASYHGIVLRPDDPGIHLEWGRAFVALSNNEDALSFILIDRVLSD